MIKRMILLGGIAAAGLAASVANAQEATYYYAGIGGGQVMVSEDESDLDDEATAFSVFWGFAVNKYFGMELAYLDTSAASDDFGGVTIETQLNGALATLRGIIPFTDNFGAYVKLGGALYDLDTDVRVGNASAKVEELSDVEEDFVYGAGVEGVFGGKFGLRVEYQVINNPDIDFETIMLSGIFRF